MTETETTPRTCHQCAAPLPPCASNNPRKWCSEACKMAHRRRSAGVRVRAHVIDPAPGTEFGRLTVRSTYGGRRYGRAIRICVCECACGTVCEIPAWSLLRGTRGRPDARGTKSCGCFRRAISRERGLRVQYGRGVPKRERARDEARRLFAEYAARIAAAQAWGAEVAA